MERRKQEQAHSEGHSGRNLPGETHSGKGLPGETHSGRNYAAVFALLAAAILVGAVLNTALGSVAIPPGRIPEILLGGGSAQERNILTQIRLPRMCMTILLGGALAVSGYLLQTFFGNPIAGPYVLGISSGAKLFVCAVLLFVAGGAQQASGVRMVLAAFAGALVTTGLIVLLSRRVRHMASLLAAGIMVGYICNALTDFLVTFAEDAQIVNLRGWSQGTFSGTDWQSVLAALVIVAVSMALTLACSKPIGAFELGEAYAASMGVDVRRYRVILILLSSLLSACVTAFAGPVSFVGIAVPFLMRGSLRSSRPLVMVPASFLGGAVFCLYADLIARMAFSPTELGISTVTSLLGAPVVIYMLATRKRS